MGLHSNDIDTGGDVELFVGLAIGLAGLAFAVVLELLESGGIFLPLAAETVFLNPEIIQLALIDQQRLGTDEVGANGLVFVCKEVGEFEPAEGVDTHFERGNAQQTPLRVGERLDEGLLRVAYGRVLLHEPGYVLFVESGVFGGQQNGAAR